MRPGGQGGTSVSVPGGAWSLGRVLGRQECQDHICILKITKVSNVAKFYCVPGLVLNALIYNNLRYIISHKICMICKWELLFPLHR